MVVITGDNKSYYLFNTHFWILYIYQLCVWVWLCIYVYVSKQRIPKGIDKDKKGEMKARITVVLHNYAQTYTYTHFFVISSLEALNIAT